MSTEHDEIARGRGIYLLPNLFTIFALFAGFYAIVAAMKGNFDNAAIAIFVAMVMDTLDGRVARLTHTQTSFGAELDSLSDMVSFGVAPALVIYSWSLDRLGKFGWLAAFVYAVAVALRLARFNVQLGTSDKRYFKGMPCPAGAAVIASIVWSVYDYGVDGHRISILMAVLAVLVGFLMVSNIRYYSFKDLDLKSKVPFIAILAIVLFLVLISVDPPQVLMVIFISYALSGPIGWIWKRHKWRRARKQGVKEKQK